MSGIFDRSKLVLTDVGKMLSAQMPASPRTRSASRGVNSPRAGSAGLSAGSPRSNTSFLAQGSVKADYSCAAEDCGLDAPESTSESDSSSVTTSVSSGGDTAECCSHVYSATAPNKLMSGRVGIPIRLIRHPSEDTSLSRRSKPDVVPVETTVPLKSAASGLPRLARRKPSGMPDINLDSSSVTPLAPRLHSGGNSQSPCTQPLAQPAASPLKVAASPFSPFKSPRSGARTSPLQAAPTTRHSLTSTPRRVAPGGGTAEGGEFGCGRRGTSLVLKISASSATRESPREASDVFLGREGTALLSSRTASKSRAVEKELSSSKSRLTEKELAAKFVDLDYFQLARNMRDAISVRERVGPNFKKIYPKTFVASDAVRYMIDVGLAETNTEVSFLCEELIGQGHIYDAVNEDDIAFHGGYHLYRFVADDRALPQVKDGDFMLQALSALESGLVPSDRRLGLTTHRGVFNGVEAVNVILQIGLVSNRADAVKVCEGLMELNYIYRVGAPADSPFLDGIALYRLNSASSVSPCKTTEFRSEGTGLVSRLAGSSSRGSSFSTVHGVTT